MEDRLILTLLKIAVMLLFFTIVLVCGTLPIRSHKFKKRPLLKAIGGTFAGCLFVNVAIMHILPESADALEDWLREGKDPDQEVFPLAYLLVMVGFIITVFFTKILSFHSHEQDHQLAADLGSSEEDPSSPIKTRQHSQKYDISDKPHKESLLSDSDKQDQSREDSRTPKSKNNKSQHSHHGHDHHGHDHHGHSHQHAHAHAHKHAYVEDEGHSIQQPHEGKHGHKAANSSILSEAYILTIAIYFHTVFEGIAIGVQDTVTGFLSTAVAIAFHKWADALSMGCHYRSKNVPKKTSYGLIAGQALLNVLAIGLGWIIASSGQVVEAVFLSISAGTFLAISTLEMLGEQLHHREYMTTKFLLLVGATGFVASIWFLENSIFGEV